MFKRFLVLAGLVIGTAALGEEFEQPIRPFLKFRAEQSKSDGEAGLSAQFGPVRVRPTLTVARTDEDATARLSTEDFAAGASLEVLVRFGVGLSESQPGWHGAVSLSGGWSGRAFTFTPVGSDDVSAFRSNWRAALTGWWFGTISTGSSAAPVPRGTPPDAQVTNFDVWIVHPQVRMEFKREWEAADDAYLVQPPDDAGRSFAEKMVVSAPSVRPRFSARLALPFVAPVFGRFALAPVGKLNTRGVVGGFDPFGATTRLVIELWGYWFAYDATSENDLAVRLGVAPLVDVRLAGTDKRDTVVFGVLFELRAGAARLEY